MTARRKKNRLTDRRRIYVLLSFLLLIVLSALFLKGCYLGHQVQGQLGVTFNRTPLTEAAAHETDPELKTLLTEIPQIVRFGIADMHLTPSGNYTSYYATDKEGITFVVTAAPKLELKPHTWWYPVVGSLPFRGYFEKAPAEQLTADMEREGFDVYMFAAPAYSTLGWFSDPVTTPMLRNGRFWMTETILHEMTHVTWFIKGEGEFNEALASFVGNAGAQDYFRKYAGDMTTDFQAVQHQKDETYRRFTDVADQVKEKLNAIYTDTSLSTEQKLSAREIVFKQAESDILAVYPKSSEKFRRLNNARLLQISRYRDDTPVFRQLYADSNGRWDIFWSKLREQPDTYLRAYKQNSIQTP